MATPAAAARPREPLWRVIVVASGSYSVDYGQDRPSPSSGVDGRGTGTWGWRMKALASGYEIDTSIAAFRMDVAEQSDIVLYTVQQNQITETPYCRPPPARPVAWVRDPSVGLFLSAAPRLPLGSRLRRPARRLPCRRTRDGPLRRCVAADTPIARGAFRPRRDRSFKDTWTQEIALDRTHESDPRSAHTFQAVGAITVSVKRISPESASRLRARLRRIPRAG